MILVLVLVPLPSGSEDKATVWRHDQLNGMEKKLSEELDSESSASQVLGTYGNDHVEIALRKATGNAELHEIQNDVFFVVSGEADLISGGKLVEPKRTEPYEFEASSIEGGKKTKLRAGDVVHIPFKVPHQLILENGKEIEYLVVKVNAR